MKKKILLTIAVLLLVFSVGTVLKTRAGVADNTSGWLWGGSEEVSDGVINGNETGVGWVSMNNTTPGAGGSTSYGVNIPPTDGNLSGYGWSENIGWVSFNFNAADVSGCPSGTCSAIRTGNNLAGWARIVGIKDALAAGNSGGWQGWVKLSGANYRVTINAGGTLSGYAWSDELGYIDFSRALITQTPAFIVCPSSATLTQGSSSQLTAYYISGGTISCSDTTGATNVTSDPGTNWTSDNSAIVSVSGGNITGNSVGGPVNVNATYSSLTASSAVTVIPLPAFCGDGIVNSGEECDDGANNGLCPAVCSSSCTVNNCGGGHWIEVAP